MSAIILQFPKMGKDLYAKKRKIEERRLREPKVDSRNAVIIVLATFLLAKLLK